MMQQVLCVLWREANGKEKRKKGKSKHCNLVKMSVGIYHSKMKDILRIAYQIDNVPTYAKKKWTKLSIINLQVLFCLTSIKSGT